MPDLQTIKAAQQAIKNRVTRTPLVPAYSLSHKNLDVRLKLETTQATGAFKLRGATNALCQLSPEQRQRGVVCASTGNHGRALAYAAQSMACKATVCLSTLVPSNKIEAIKKLGAEVRIQGDSQDEAQQLVDQLVAEFGMNEVPPFDHSDVMSGQGTIGLELLEDWPEVDTILIGLSGGGLLGGIALAAKSIKPDINIIGISPQRGASMAASLEAGKPVDVAELPTLADSLGGSIGLQNQYTFETVQSLMDDLILLSEIQIAEAMRFLYLNERLVTEGGAAVGAAVLIDPSIKARLGNKLGKNIAIIISGHNIDMAVFQQVINKTHAVYG